MTDPTMPPYEPVGYVSDEQTIATLRAALDAVEREHTLGVVAGDERCNGCSAPERGYVVPWPCPTRRAIFDAMQSASTAHTDSAT